MDFVTIGYALIGVGLVLLLAELVLPTHGVLAMLGLAAIVVGTAFTFHDSAATGFKTLLAVVIGLPLLASLALYIWPRTPMGKRFILQAPDDDDAVAGNPVMLELEQLRGKFGRTLSALRPCGVVDFGGKRVDTVTDGAMIEPHQWVRCVDVKAGRVLVRAVDKPPDLNAMDTALFDQPRS
jgi:membrane-bound serine protease (ClpP class)